jgi:EAL domain-containing protein (putative c-di-GMP-specific phosphodiesterase class I)
VVDLAHRFGAVVCAEGLETADDLRCLLAMGCDIAQGYLFARPMPPDRFAQVMLARAASTASVAEQKQAAAETERPAQSA